MTSPNVTVKDKRIGNRLKSKTKTKTITINEDKDKTFLFNSDVSTLFVKKTILLFIYLFNDLSFHLHKLELDSNENQVSRPVTTRSLAQTIQLIESIFQIFWNYNLELTQFSKLLLFPYVILCNQLTTFTVVFLQL